MVYYDLVQTSSFVMPSPEHQYPDNPLENPESPKERMTLLLSEWMNKPPLDQERQQLLAKDLITPLLDYFAVLQARLVSPEWDNLDTMSKAEAQKQVDDIELQLYNLIFVDFADYPNDIFVDNTYKILPRAEQEKIAHAYFSLLRRLVRAQTSPLEYLYWDEPQK